MRPAYILAIALYWVINNTNIAHHQLPFRISQTFLPDLPSFCCNSACYNEEDWRPRARNHVCSFLESCLRLGTDYCLASRHLLLDCYSRPESHFLLDQHNPLVIPLLLGQGHHLCSRPLRRIPRPRNQNQINLSRWGEESPFPIGTFRISDPVCYWPDPNPDPTSEDSDSHPEKFENRIRFRDPGYLKGTVHQIFKI